MARCGAALAALWAFAPLAAQREMKTINDSWAFSHGLSLFVKFNLNGLYYGMYFSFLSESCMESPGWHVAPGWVVPVCPVLLVGLLATKSPIMQIKCYRRLK